MLGGDAEHKRIYLRWGRRFCHVLPSSIALCLLRDPDRPSGCGGSQRWAILSRRCADRRTVCVQHHFCHAGRFVCHRINIDPLICPRVALYAGRSGPVERRCSHWLWVGRRSVLIMVMVGDERVCDRVCMIAFPIPAPLQLGWYGRRVFGALSGSLLLFVLL